ncbi:hypothetical protein CEXT_443211 [Caerostris extrusa]|uniref:Uncharacterized protein n=1 Tax=Caerostris extrusa TaxID=172846 RepID=A0AAV4Y8A3_CAEEX|nr:hypothetical protein CEXT_443211 [Caerostris extrusa]
MAGPIPHHNLKDTVSSKCVNRQIINLERVEKMEKKELKRVPEFQTTMELFCDSLTIRKVVEFESLQEVFSKKGRRAI